MLRKFLCAGFPSSPGDGARAVMTGNYESPTARGTYMLRKFLYAGFPTSPGDGARAVMMSNYEKNEKKEV